MNIKYLNLLVLSFLVNTTLLSQLPSEFTWTDVHGKNWITTSNKDQKFQGPCNTFASCALTEARFNLEFNSNFGKDLSEWHVYSYPCWLHYPVAIQDALYIIKTQGVLNESCLPFPSVNSPACVPNPYNPANDGYTCDSPCALPSEKLKITQYSSANFSTNEAIKKTLICNGPIAVNFTGVSNMHQDATHAYLLVGWEDISASRVKWQFKDSWPGPTSGCEPNPLYGSRLYYKEVDLTSASAIHGYYIPASSTVDRFTKNGSNWVESNPSLSANANYDQDNDGYYFWGFGPRPLKSVPANAPIDLDDNNSNSGYINSNCEVVGGSPSCPPQGNLAIASSGDYDYLCPSNSYQFYVSGVPQGSSVNWTRTPTYMSQFTTSTSSAYVWLSTNSNFGYVILTATVNPNVSGCPSYSVSRTYYHGNCSGGWYMKEQDISIFPNPAHADYVSLVFPADVQQIDAVSIINIAGQIQSISTSLKNENLRIPINDLENGIYYIRIQIEDQHYLKKLVIQK